ncbi:hypothetical protein EYF80_029518 [Liparis tanakae]|uniref:Uncharacterized protein n=1 Tax=Liparis tanakae TaxID=230148 RepID=A0A4Z2H4Q0_9TELE|nr:hypothetical protein EYF80_029518 [Liparis tanakae]
MMAEEVVHSSHGRSWGTSITCCTHRAWGARKSLGPEQTFWTRISSVSLEGVSFVSEAAGWSRWSTLSLSSGGSVVSTQTKRTLFPWRSKRSGFSKWTLAGLEAALESQRCPSLQAFPEDLEDLRHRVPQRDQDYPSATNKHQRKPYKHKTVKQRPSDLQTVRPSDLQTFRPLDLQTFRPSDRQTFRPSDRQTVRPSDLQTVRPSDLQTVRPSDLQTFRPSDR